MSAQPTGRPSPLKPRAYGRWWLATVKQAWVDGWVEASAAKTRHQQTKTILREAEAALKNTADLDEQVRIMAHASANMDAIN